MTTSGPRSPAGRQALDAILNDPSAAMIGVDFDGTLAPIVDDPEQAFAEPAAVEALGRLGAAGVTVVVITGRPVRTAVRLGRFGEQPGLGSMIVLGQYGVERWDARTDAYTVPPEPEAITALRAALPSLLADHDAASARVENKGRALGVHTRGLPDPGGAFRRLSGPLRALTEQHGLLLEPGKNVLEIRAPGTDKGDALRAVVAELGVRQLVFAGDDLGDLPASRAAQQLRSEGIGALLVCSTSTEEDALVELADVVLDGPPAVAAWLADLADRLTPSSGDLRSAGPAVRDLHWCASRSGSGRTPNSRSARRSGS